jgi:hypothetical protein
VDLGIAAAAKSYAVFTAVLLAIVVDDVVATLSETFDWSDEGVTAFVAFVPACVSMSVASWTAPTLVVVELVIDTTEPGGVVVTTMGAVPVIEGRSFQVRLPDPSVCSV